MPKAFERERRKRGRRVRTVTKGPGKGKLIAVGGDHPVLGGFPEGRKKAGGRRGGRRGKGKGHKKYAKGSAADFERFM